MTTSRVKPGHQNISDSLPFSFSNIVAPIWQEKSFFGRIQNHLIGLKNLESEKVNCHRNRNADPRTAIEAAMAIAIVRKVVKATQTIVHSGYS